MALGRGADADEIIRLWREALSEIKAADASTDDVRRFARATDRVYEQTDDSDVDDEATAFFEQWVLHDEPEQDDARGDDAVKAWHSARRPDCSADRDDLGRFLIAGRRAMDQLPEDSERRGAIAEETHEVLWRWLMQRCDDDEAPSLADLERLVNDTSPYADIEESKALAFKWVSENPDAIDDDGDDDVPELDRLDAAADDELADAWPLARDAMTPSRSLRVVSRFARLSTDASARLGDDAYESQARDFVWAWANDDCRRRRGVAEPISTLGEHVESGNLQLEDYATRLRQLLDDATAASEDQVDGKLEDLKAASREALEELPDTPDYRHDPGPDAPRDVLEAVDELEEHLGGRREVLDDSFFERSNDLVQEAWDAIDAARCCVDDGHLESYAGLCEQADGQFRGQRHADDAVSPMELAMRLAGAEEGEALVGAIRRPCDAAQQQTGGGADDPFDSLAAAYVVKGARLACLLAALPWIRRLPARFRKPAFLVADLLASAMAAAIAGLLLPDPWAVRADVAISLAIDAVAVALVARDLVTATTLAALAPWFAALP